MVCELGSMRDEGMDPEVCYDLEATLWRFKLLNEELYWGSRWSLRLISYWCTGY